MNRKFIGNQYLGLAFIKNEDLTIAISIYPLRLTINHFVEDGRLQIRFSIFKLAVGIFLEI